MKGGEAVGSRGDWRLRRGARVGTDDSAHFEVWAPAARRVRVRLGTEGSSREIELEGDVEGVFSGRVPHAPVGTRYAYLLDDDETAYPDPVSRSQPDGVHGPSAIVDPQAFMWTDGAWRGCEMADLVIYEMHVGTFSEAGTFDSAISHLEELVRLGVTAIEIMPVAEFPGSRNWGYDGVHIYAPQSSYGGPDGFRRLVDSAHNFGLAVVLDVVYNHLGPEGNYLGRFGPYFTERYRTPWGSAVNYDDADSDEVRRWVVDNARYWIGEFHVDALRLDAVHAIFDFGARHLLEEIREAVHEEGEAAGRRALVIAESDLNDPRLIRPPERGGFGLDGQWSDDFHHAVHALLTEEASGYYSDFTDPLAVPRAIRDRFVYAGNRSGHRRRRHGAPASDVPGDRFVIAIQNHDQIGNRANGDRLASLVDERRLRLGAALLLLSPYVPLLFMGEEWGETNPFLYFVSHGNADLAEAVRQGRREEFASFAWGGEVPDPMAESTFTSSRLDRGKREQPRHRAVLSLYEDLLRLRRHEPALRPGVAEVRVEHGAGGEWMSLRLQPRTTDQGLVGAPDRAPGLLALFNLSDAAQTVPAADAGALLLHTGNARYSGESAADPDPTVDSNRSIELQPHSAALFRLNDHS